MLYEMVELEEGVLVQFLAVQVLRWDWNLMGKPTHGFVQVDPETTHEDLVHLKRIAQRVRGELARAKPGSAVWEAMRFILSSPIEKAQEEPTWESAGRDHEDHPVHNRTYGATDG